MKKVIVALMVFVLMLCGMPAGLSKSCAVSLFTDVSVSAWYYKDLEYIAKDSRKIMEGYAGKFGPLDSLTVEQFLKCVTVASGFVAPTIKPGEKWSLPFIGKAVEMKLVQSGEFTDYTRPITRAEMARIIILSLPSITGETGSAYDLNAIRAKIIDYETIPLNLKEDVCKAYQLGILTGGSDGKFNPNGSLQRASTVSAIRKLIDKSARLPVQGADASESEMWSDAEFEAFLRSAEVKDYVNTYKVARIENRKIYWKSESNYSGILIPEKNNPGINDMVYNLVKIISYHTKKTDGYTFISFSDNLRGGTFYINFYTGKFDYSYMSNGPIELWISCDPQKSLTADEYFPGKQKGDTHYEWILGAIREKDALRGYEPGMDRTKFEWTAPRYENIFREMCLEVYGQKQGNLFYNFALNELDKSFFVGGGYKGSFIGLIQDIDCELVYYTPEERIAGIRFSTDKPEVEK